MRKPAIAAATFALLVLGGCNKTPQQAAADGNLNDVSGNEVDLGNGAGTEPAVVQVVPVPTPPADAPAPDAAPLKEAAATTAAIDQGSDVERIPYQGGWAWRRSGQIIRTASADGRRVSYFHGGETTPYLVQDGDRAFAYNSGQVQRGYDDHGRTVQVDQSRRQQGQQLVRQSTQERQAAKKAAAEHPQAVQKEQTIRAHAGHGPGQAQTDRGPASSNDSHSRAGNDAGHNGPSDQQRNSDKSKHGGSDRHSRDQERDSM
jgi:hypothetical protein